MKVGVDRDLSACKCTNCGVELIGAACVDDEDSAPAPGAIMVCIYCGHLMGFNEDRTLRELTDAEIIEAAGKPEILIIQKVRGYIQRRIRLHLSDPEP